MNRELVATYEVTLSVIDNASDLPERSVSVPNGKNPCWCLLLVTQSRSFQAWDGLRASPGLAIRKESQASAARPTEESGYLRIMTTTLRLRVTVALNVWDLHPQTLRGRESVNLGGEGVRVILESRVWLE